MELLTLLFIGASTLVFLFFTVKYTYWKRRNVPSPIPFPILGNYKDYFTFRKTFGVTAENIYKQFPKEPFVGAYYATEPVLIPRDPEMIRTIMAKDFYNFSGRMLVDHEFRDPLIAANVFTTSGDNWKALRSNLNPMFSSAKLKNMFHLVADSGAKLDGYLDDLYNQSSVQDFKVIATKYILEVIGSCIFGLQFDTLVQEDTTIKKVADKLNHLSNKKALKTYIQQVWPNLYHMFTKNNPQLSDGVDNIFMNLAKQGFESRGNKPTGRNDLVDLLLKFKEKGFVEGDGVRNQMGEANRIKIEATDMMMASQALVFFGAGFETSSTALSFTLYELGKHPEIQQRVVEEIDNVLKNYNGEVTYESIQDMKYLDMVMSETLRMYPVLGVITRECMNDYKFADYGLQVPKGMRIHIPVWAIHHDPKYYPEPQKYDPERFSPEEVQKRHPYTYLAFGEGHRICIGLRFSKVQVALGLIRILRRYKLERCDKTLENLKFDARAFGITPTSPLHLRMVPRN